MASTKLFYVVAILLVTLLTNPALPCQVVHSRCFQNSDCCTKLCAKPELTEFGWCHLSTELADKENSLARKDHDAVQAYSETNDFTLMRFKRWAVNGRKKSKTNSHANPNSRSASPQRSSSLSRVQSSSPSLQRPSEASRLRLQPLQTQNGQAQPPVTPMLHSTLTRKPQKMNPNHFDPSAIKPKSNLPDPVAYRDSSGLVREVQKNPHAGDRVEYVRAHIKPEHLGKGSPTNQRTRDYAAKMGNNKPEYQKDQAGHEISSLLGASGRKENNISPQSPLMNNVAMKRVEKQVAKEVKTTGQDRVLTFRNEYKDPMGKTPSTRPFGKSYKVEDSNGNLLHTGLILNPLIPNGKKAKDVYKDGTMDMKFLR